MLTTEALYHPPDAYGECDNCHDYPLQLWEDYDERGEFQFCAFCIRRWERAHRKRQSKVEG